MTKRRQAIAAYVGVGSVMWILAAIAKDHLAIAFLGMLAGVMYGIALTIFLEPKL